MNLKTITPLPTEIILNSILFSENSTSIKIFFNLKNYLQQRPVLYEVTLSQEYFVKHNIIDIDSLLNVLKDRLDKKDIKEKKM